MTLFRFSNTVQCIKLKNTIRNKIILNLYDYLMNKNCSFECALNKAFIYSFILILRHTFPNDYNYFVVYTHAQRKKKSSKNILFYIKLKINAYLTLPAQNRN